MSDIINQLIQIVWGPPIMLLLIGTGLYLSFRLKGIQFTGFAHGFDIITGKYDKKEDPGEISHFKALATALSATIGTGNIVGVAAAILAGGPGAVFWMWITALVGMATKYVSCTLSVYYRRKDDQGQMHGGPMHYIEQGLGPKFKWLAYLFAGFTVIASFGIGNMFQVKSMLGSIHKVFQINQPDNTTINLFIGFIIAAIVASVILGGIKRIAHLASKLVPFMCAIYIIGGIIILVKNFSLIPEAISLIFYHAFNAPESVAGGLLGGVIRSGVARGLFSNEAGLGSAPMAHGAAKTKEPVREGLVAMLGPFIDTILVCSITALVIISTKAHETVTNKALLTTHAFEQGLPGSGLLVSIGIILFAFSTLIAWSYYGDRCAAYIFGSKSVPIYRWVYVVIILVGATQTLDEVINFCDLANGLMALPNLIALIALTPIVISITQNYFNRTN